jgi:hypothetical protein
LDINLVNSHPLVLSGGMPVVKTKDLNNHGSQKT